MLTVPYAHERRIIGAYPNNKVCPLGIRLALLCEQGTGKTWTVLDLMERHGLFPALVVCPAQVLGTWEQEISKHTTLGFQIVEGSRRDKTLKLLNPQHINVVSYESIAREIEFEPRIFKFVVCDEASILSNRNKTSSILERMFRNLKNKAVMTGTVISEKYNDVFGIYKFLNGSSSFFGSYYNFLQKYFDTEGKITDYGARTIMGMLRNDPKTFIFSKSECLDLPDKIYQVIGYDLSEDQKRVEKQILEDWEMSIEGMEFKEFMYTVEQLQKAMQVSSGFIYGPEGNIKTHWFHPNPKIQALRQYLHDNRDDNILILFQYKAEKKLLSDLGIRIINDPRKELVGIEHPKNGFLAAVQIRKVAMGLNLQWLHALVFFSNSFSCKMRLQAEDRIHRSGLEHKVSIVDIISRTGFDQRVYYILRKKKEPLRELYNANTGNQKSFSI